jgi:PAS domain S-box-containing protein
VAYSLANGAGIVALVAGLGVIGISLYRMSAGRTPAEAQVGSQENYYRLLTENLAAAVIIRDANGRITYCSPFIEFLTGYSMSDLMSGEADFFETLLHPDDLTNYRTGLRYARSGEFFEYRHRLHPKGGGIERWVETRIAPLPLGDTGEFASLSITFDVTAAVRQKAQLEEQNRDLQDFSYMLSHDLKSPLQTIKGMLQVIQQDKLQLLAEESREALVHIDHASKRLEKLIGAVLEYSKVSSASSTLSPVAIEEVVSEVRAELKPRFAEAQAELRIEGQLPAVVADRLKLYQVFLNLLTNSLKYRAGDRPLVITITSRKARLWNRVEVLVSDNGSGIPADKLPEIFRPFRRAHGPEIEGSGIGLASVKKLMEKCGGSVSAESDFGEGTTFILSFKLAS